MAAKVSHLVDGWIRIDSAPRSGALFANTADAAVPGDRMFAKTITATADIATADAFSGIPVTASASFKGENTSDPNDAGEAIYTETKNLGTAMASIMYHVQKKADFHPANTPPEKLGQSVSRYVGEVDATPFFHLAKHDVSGKPCNFGELIGEASSLFEGVPANDLENIRTKMSEMVTWLTQNAGDSGELKKNLFSQTSLDLTNKQEPKFECIYLSLSYSHYRHTSSSCDFGGIFGCSENVEDRHSSDYQLDRRSYVVLPDMIKAYAKTLADGVDKKTVDDWMKDSLTG